MRATIRALCIILFSSGTAAASDPALLVFVSVPPQKTFVERVGKEHVRVEVMVQPGHSPAAYDPTPRQIAALSGADLYVRTGVPFEDAWMTRIRAVNSHMAILDARGGIAAREMGPHDHGEARGKPHPADELDPHLWTSPPLVKEMSRRIRNQLIALDSDHRSDYEQGFSELAADLDALDREIRARLSGISKRQFMVFHPAWGYFADTYDLEQVTVQREGKEPGPKALAALIDQAQREELKVIFVQPQFSRRAAERIARAIGGRVESIDPLAADYFANMRRVASTIAEANKP